MMVSLEKPARAFGGVLPHGVLPGAWALSLIPKTVKGRSLRLIALGG